MRMTGSRWALAGGLGLHAAMLGSVVFLLTVPGRAAAQVPDSAAAQVRTVLRAYYLNFDSGNWDALAAYVLSPKLLERRGVPADSALVLRDRTRRRAGEHAATPPSHCPAPGSAMIDSAAVRIDGDWAEVSVPRCKGEQAGVDEFRLIYFEQRWRFIYSDMF